MINLTNLNFHYRKSRNVLNNVTTKLIPGQIYGLLGLNGVGKTTLLKLLAGISFPKSGEIRINNSDPKTRGIDFLMDLFFFEDEPELPNWSISKYLNTYSSLYEKFDTPSFYQILEQFAIDRDEHISNLSYGQKKKLHIAFGLATKARLLLMDEPTNGLDIPSKSQLRKVIAQSIDSDTLLILSTHQIRDIHNLIDHLLILQDRRLLVDRSIESLSHQFRFTTQPLAHESILHTENSLHGTTYFVINETKQNSNDFDIESFFNIISATPTILTETSSTNSKTLSYE